jgi:hypothetical protein
LQYNLSRGQGERYHAVTPEAWQALAAIVGTVGTATSAIAVAMLTRTRRDAKRGAEAAESAAANTEPISDGFAKRTTETLADLGRRSRAHEARLTWITDALGQHLTLHHADDLRRNGMRAAPPSSWWPPGGEEAADMLFGFGDLSPDDEDRADEGRWGSSHG